MAPLTRSLPLSRKYADNWEKIFGKKKGQAQDSDGVAQKQDDGADAGRAGQRQ